MLDLETLFIAGLPSNKLEILDGRVHCCLPFRTRPEAEATFDHWVATLCRWKQQAAAIEKGPRLWTCALGELELTLERRRIDARIPFHCGAHYELVTNAWDPKLWPSGGGGTTFSAYQEAQQKLFRAFCVDRDDDDAYNGVKVSLRADLVLTESSVLTPTLYVLPEGSWQWVGGKGDYLQGVPGLVVEIATPATRADDLPNTGRRAGVLAQAGVPSYWLVDPGNAVVTVHELAGRQYRAAGTFGRGATIRPKLPEGVEVRVSELFECKHEMPPILIIGEKPDLDGPGFSVPDEPIGIEHLMLAGHPQKRYEVLDDTAPCVLAFRDPAKARRSFEHWAREAARIEGVPPPARLGDTFEAGRYRLGHESHRVHLNLRYAGRVQREILEVIALPGVWETEPEEPGEPAR